MKSLRVLICFVAYLSLSVNVAQAHHGLAEYDTSAPIELRGKVIDFTLMDPHSLLVVAVTNADGTTTTWTIEGGRAHGIIAAGLSKEKLASQPNVIVQAYRKTGIECAETCFANGRHFAFE